MKLTSFFVAAALVFGSSVVFSHPIDLEYFSRDLVDLEDFVSRELLGVLDAREFSDEDIFRRAVNVAETKPVVPSKPAEKTSEVKTGEKPMEKKAGELKTSEKPTKDGQKADEKSKEGTVKEKKHKKHHKKPSKEEGKKELAEKDGKKTESTQKDILKEDKSKPSETKTKTSVNNAARFKASVSF